MTPDEILNLWNETVTEPIKQARMTPKRRTLLRARLRDHPDPDVWREGIARIEASSFCRGENGRGWVARFGLNVCSTRDFIMNAFEGQYDDRFSEAELERASSARWSAWGGRCRHTVGCETVEECVGKWARAAKRKARG